MDTFPNITLKNEHPGNRLNVWYLYHSGYAVRTENCLLLFDYWNDEATEESRTLDNGVFDPVVWLEDAVRTETGIVPNVVVFSSHKHGDHFNPAILEWQNTLPSIRYILSNDIPKRHLPGIPKVFIHEAGTPTDEVDQARILFMKAHETLALPQLDMRVHTFRSTDAGVAFWVEVEGTVVYHAGDLNLWYWEEEKKSWNNNMIARYGQELAAMEEWLAITKKRPDVACLPIDPRLGAHWLDGYRLFMDRIGAEAIFPMHFGDPAILSGLQAELSDEPAPFRDNLHLPDKRGARFALQALCLCL